MSNKKLLYIILGIALVIFIFRNFINRLFMFDIIIGVILRHEGGYVNDPDDLGGETKYGISKRNFPNVDIKNLTKAQAIELYRQNYYIPLEIGKMTNMNLALNYMDMAVNAGINTAKRLLKEAKEIQKTSSSDIVTIYKALRVDYYKDIAKLRNNQKFLAGWLNRVKSSNIA